MNAGSAGSAAAAAADPRPQYRVAVFGLGHKFHRLMEIVLRHARHNRYRYVLASARGPGEYDIALVDMTVRGGPEVASTLRRLPAPRPVVRVGRRTDDARGRDDLLQQTFTMHLLNTLNRVVEEVLLGRAPAAVPFAAAVLVPGEGVAGARRARALLVDDSPTVRRQLSVALQRMGLDSEEAESAGRALDALSANRFELVFVDVVMPGMDGYKLTRTIKRDPALRATPVVILTGRSSPFDLARGALAGCNGYLVKPVTLGSLRETVMRHVGSSGAGAGGFRVA